MAYVISDVVTDSRGVPVTDALVYVFGPDGDLASLYDTLGDPIDNPLATGDGGEFRGFSEVQGYHTVKINYGGRERLVKEVLAGFDPITRAEAAAASAEAFTGPTFTSVAEGLAATISGQYFAVTIGGIATVYLNSSGSAVYQRDMVTATALSSTATNRGAGLTGFAVGSTYQANTAGSKLQQIPATSDYANTAALVASSRDWFFAPTDSSFEVSGAFAKRFFGPGNVHLPSGDVPGWQGGAVHGFSTYYPGENTGQQFAFVSKSWVGGRIDGGSAPGQDHLVSVYGEASRGVGASAGVWAFNTVTNVTNLDGPTIGYEVDMNNLSGVDPGLSPSHAYYGLSIISGAEGRGGTAFAVDRNGDYSNNGWNRGLHVKEVYQRAIEFTNCGFATGLFTDTTMVFKALTDAPIVRFTPFNDANLTDPLLYLTDANNSLIVARWNKRGEIAIGGVGTQGMNSMGARQITNGDNILFLQRLTDTSPAGTFLRAVNAANNINFFDIDFNTNAGETNVRLSVAGAAATRVSVGAADSAGTGYRALRVPN